MRATVTVVMAGNPGHDIGDVVDGIEAVRLIAAGFADRIEEEETASIDPVEEIAVVKPKRSPKPKA